MSQVERGDMLLFEIKLSLASIFFFPSVPFYRDYTRSFSTKYIADRTRMACKYVVLHASAHP